MKKKKDIEIEVEDFKIFQVFRPKEHSFGHQNYVKGIVASPFFGSQVVDNQTYIDNTGIEDLEERLDFARKPEDRHMSKEDLIKKYGTQYYDYQILNNKKINELTGFQTTTEIKTKTINNKHKNEVKKSKISFIETLEDLNNEEEIKENVIEESNNEVDILNENEEFNVNIQVIEEDEVITNNKPNTITEVPQENIPTFLFEDDVDEEEDYTLDDETDFDAIVNLCNEKGYKFVEIFNKIYNNQKATDDDIKLIDKLYNEINELKIKKFNRNLTIDEKFKWFFHISNQFKSYMTNPNIDLEIEIYENFCEKLAKSNSLLQALRLVISNEENNEVKVEPVLDEPIVTDEIKPKAEIKETNIIQNNTNISKYDNYEVPYGNFFEKAIDREEELPQWLEEKKEVINQTLEAFKISGEVINYIKGPSFTLYEIALGSGVNVKKVSQIYENLQMNLETTSLRLLTPIPGRSTVGVEVPNVKRDTVVFSEIVDDDFINDGKPLNVTLGKDIYGKNIRLDIVDMPHAIIAGATKSGKSVCINTILISLLLKNSPDSLRLILVDPKTVELSFYQDIPHLACPVLDNPEEATEALHWAVEEMENRFKLLAQYRVKKIDDYDKKRKTNPEMPPMPYIVIVIDEFNDLKMQCGQEVEDYIIRLAQKARAAGIHVIIATQRPTVDVVSGTIKSNVPCRIAFKVTDATNSVVILDEGGAENLLGRGDMLIKNNDAAQRAQGAYISDDEIESVCNYISSKYTTDFLFTDKDLRNNINSRNQTTATLNPKGAPDESPQKLYEIAKFCVESNVCSINAITTNFSIGFNRAQRIVNQFEELGIVSVKNGNNKAREILVDTIKLKEIFGIDEE